MLQGVCLNCTMTVSNYNILNICSVLQAFLSKYVDESAVFRRRSQSEDDNPPSPVPLDPADGAGTGFLSTHRAPQSPSGLRFHPPLTPPSGSNPHTPASPHTSNISQVQYLITFWHNFYFYSRLT